MLPGPDLWPEGVCVTASHKITLLCHTLQLKDAVASTTASQREGRGLGGIKTTESAFLRPRPNTARRAGVGLLLGTLSFPFCVPQEETVGQREGSLGAAQGSSHEPQAVCRAWSCGMKGRAGGPRAAARAHALPRQKTSAKVARGACEGCHPRGSWTEMDRLSPVGLQGEEEHHASAKEVQGATLSRCWFACAAGSPYPLVGLGGGGRLGGRGEHQATRL